MCWLKSQLAYLKYTSRRFLVINREMYLLTSEIQLTDRASQATYPRLECN